MSSKTCLGVLVLSAIAFGQGDTSEPKLIAYAKKLDVSRLDPTLPNQALEKWLDAQGIAADQLLWRRSDCGLMPDSERPEDPRPLCVEFVVSVTSNAGVVAMIFVGTDQKEIDGPAKFGGMHMMKGPLPALQVESAEQLSKLPRLIERARSADK
jgi:hypothetical protein